MSSVAVMVGSDEQLTLHQRSNQILSFGRGRSTVLGGSSVVDYMVYVREQATEYSLKNGHPLPIYPSHSSNASHNPSDNIFPGNYVHHQSLLFL